MTIEVVEQAKKIQDTERLTNDEIARKIGVHPVYWCRIKNYKASPGSKFLSGLRKAYPGTRKAIDLFLSSELTTVNK